MVSINPEYSNNESEYKLSTQNGESLRAKQLNTSAFLVTWGNVEHGTDEDTVSEDDFKDSSFAEKVQEFNGQLWKNCRDVIAKIFYSDEHQNGFTYLNYKVEFKDGEYIVDRKGFTDGPQAFKTKEEAVDFIDKTSTSEPQKEYFEYKGIEVNAFNSALYMDPVTNNASPYTDGELRTVYGFRYNGVAYSANTKEHAIQIIDEIVK